jgi:hypothetical protein
VHAQFPVVIFCLFFLFFKPFLALFRFFGNRLGFFVIAFSNSFLDLLVQVFFDIFVPA